MPSPKLSRKTVLVSSVAGAFAVIGGGAVIAEAAARRGDEEEPAGDEAAAPTPDWVESQLAGMSLEDKVGQLFMVYVHGESADTGQSDAVASNMERLGAANGAAFIAAFKPGGIIYFDWSNGLSDPAQVAALSNGLQEASEIPLLIATDQEYGSVVRIGEPATQFPGAMPLGATRDTEAARRAAEAAGAELRAMGLNLNFAPDADVNVDPRNPVIGVRSFSSDPALVAEFTTAQAGGYQAGGVAVAAKHFPGHGDTGTDSHVGLPVITHSAEEWERIDAPPFTAAIAAGTDMVMSGHLQFPALDDSLKPATLSAPILTGLLRERLGFEGVVVTDSLEMEGVRAEFGDERVPVMALQAGVDLLLMPPDFQLAFEAVLAAVESGELTEERIDASVRRLLALKVARGIIAEPATDPAGTDVVGSDEHRQVAADIADRSITLLANDGTLPFAGGSVLVTGWGENTTARLTESLNAEGLQAEALVTGEEPSAEQVKAAVTAAAGRDLVIVTTFGAEAGGAQADLVAELLKTGVPVVHAAVGTPYDAAHVGAVNASLATYSYTAASLGALAKVVTGAVDPSGTLPVDVPGADGAVAFAFGHGLRYT
ncbi:glycoside hydrolase family 3 protein [Glycomyces algeriensis]|uniref:beta-N-acetylhexosaminidase n=1 Tax=Glycomyces algeriensis TaxID=256037 RepID=A0A9W6G6J1_9ACTN|nr:glycoside hydrolase family 3 protein [Glycomyces algeriensis]MDA1365873.1 glycoside hydrolase family 3 C-terminal domain-containing protein [Glycomyces algeriensis]MDR7349362.1 beta-N-acetylhexosaminidase [Glycomyces algeriensis]GLI42064.1 beta-N-acetylhexosaminidase [Glycomyces algeriensis]